MIRARVRRTRGSVMTAMSFENEVSVGVWIVWKNWFVAVFSVIVFSGI